MSNDFVLSGGRHNIELLSRDLNNWRITFADTGLNSNIGQRLLRVRKYLERDPVFLANYADGLSDLPLDNLIADFERKKVVASFATVRSPQSFHTVSVGEDGYVSSMGTLQTSPVWINGGFFVLRRDIFEYIHEGE